MATLDLYLHDQKVGCVEADPRNKTRVTLDVHSDYSGKVLLSESFAAIPGRRAPTDSVTSLLGGYVPEGNHRERMAAKRHIDKDDLFALLREFGGSIAGAISLRGTTEGPAFRPTYEPMDNRTLAIRLKQALEDGDQGIPGDSRSTLPGYQPKVLVARCDGGWAYPHGRAHSTYILKPQVPARPSRIFDEHYSHLLTRHMGLSSYKSEIHKAGQTTYLAIERFDRVVDGQRIHLHHQEDLAQALGLDWSDADAKFQNPAWPKEPKRATVRKIAELLGSIPGGEPIVERWIVQLTYNLAIGNNDAHAKNVALMHLQQRTELADVYDAVPNLFQPGRVKWDLALAIGGVFDHRKISAELLLAETQSWGVISAVRAEQIVSDALVSLDQALSEVRPPKGVSDGMVQHIARSVQRLRAGDEISQTKR